MPSNDLNRQIEAAEHWLAKQDVQVEPPPGCLARVKHRVQIAIDEAWLAEQSVDVPVRNVLAAAKQAVAGELAEDGARLNGVGSTDATDKPGLASHRIYRLFTASAAAAVLLVATGLGIRSALSPTNATSGDDGLTQLVEIMARDFDDEETEWAAIEEELVSLEAALASGYDSPWDTALPDEWTNEMDAPTDGLNMPHVTSEQGAI